MLLHFAKMNAGGNDFILLDDRRGKLALEREKIARLCDRHRGVGADGLLVAEAPRGEGEVRMRYFNADGGEAEMCGNGARCLAKFMGRQKVRMETAAGLVFAELAGENVRLSMSEPRGMQLGSVNFIHVGVPHGVVMVDDLDAVPVEERGAALRRERDANVDFVQALDARTLAIRTYERGVEGETLSCGTGAVAAALVFHALTGAKSPVSVRTRGGDVLVVDFERGVTLTGAADFVFEGTIVI